MPTGNCTAKDPEHPSMWRHCVLQEDHIGLHETANGRRWETIIYPDAGIIIICEYVTPIQRLRQIEEEDVIHPDSNPKPQLEGSIFGEKLWSGKDL